MSELFQESCTTIRSGTSPLTAGEITTLKPAVAHWKIQEYEGVPQLQNVYRFPDFQQAIAFTNAIGEIAETEGHHPALLTEWGKVTVSWWTHDIGGLHKNDFILAARTDRIYQKLTHELGKN